MIHLILRLKNILIRETRKVFNNISDRLSILFQMFHERIKYRSNETRWIWKRVKLTKEQKKKIDSFYKKNYGKRIPYTYHRLFMSFTGNFDERIIPEMLYATYFERFQTDLSYGKVFTNKNTLAIFARGLNVKTPTNIIICNNGRYYDNEFCPLTLKEVENILYNVGKVFVKITKESCGGQGVSLANFINGVNVNTGLNIVNTLSSLGNDFCIQELIICHDSIREIYSNSVNTFRIITYLLDDEVYYCPIIMRMGSGGSFADNASLGGIFIALDDDGTLHKTAFTELREEYTCHPDTNVVFEGRKVKYLEKVINAAKRLQHAIPQVGCVNWDFTIDSTGEPILIEANMKNGVQSGSIWLPQMAHGKGAFGDNTARVLQYIRKAKKKSFTKRKNIKL